MGQMIPDRNHKTPVGLQTNGVADKLHHDSSFTDKVIAASGPNIHPRLAQVMPSLLRHLHGFAREVNLTVGEWTAAVEFVSDVLRFSPSPSCDAGRGCGTES